MEYDRALVNRGNATFWLTPRAIATWSAVGVGKRRGQLQYSDLAIETALTLRLVFRLPLRQTAGVCIIQARRCAVSSPLNILKFPPVA